MLETDTFKLHCFQTLTGKKTERHICKNGLTKPFFVSLDVMQMQCIHFMKREAQNMLDFSSTGLLCIHVKITEYVVSYNSTHTQLHVYLGIL